jgi:predicted GNAT family acetyltransferase
MKETFQHIALTKNEYDHRFEMMINGSKAFIDYKENGDTITLLHTEVEPALEGRGAATALIEKTLAYLEKNNIKLIPLCPMVVVYIKRHPEWKRIVDKSVRIFER